MNNSYITIIKEKRTDLSRKRIPLNQNKCTADFRMSVPFEQNLQGILNERGMMKTELIREAKISTNAMAKLGRNEDVRVEILVKICKALDCKIDDVIEY